MGGLAVTKAPADPADLLRVLEAASVVTVALEGDDEALGRHVALLLHEIDGRARSASDRTYQRAMLIGALGAIAALALQQWAHEDPSKANDWLQIQAATYEATFDPKE